MSIWYFPRADILCYYIDRCDLRGFIRAMNAGTSHVRYQFFLAGTTFTHL
jgi:hypothetical protein